MSGRKATGSTRGSRRARALRDDPSTGGPRGRVPWVIARLATALLFAACGDDTPARIRASDDPRHNVMIIDEGFDLSVDALRGKVAAAYTLTCAGGAGAPTSPGDSALGTPDAGTGTSFDDMKGRLLASLAVKDESCGLTEGVSAKSDPLASIAKYRQRLDDAFRAQKTLGSVFTQAEGKELIAALMPELMTFSYHGTATAGAVAHENGDARLVLVERVLSTEAMVRGQITCIAQADLDQTVALLTDPDVRVAYLGQPPSRLDDDMNEVRARFRVGIVNESFGTPARATLEQFLTDNGCAPVDFAPYFSTLNALDRTRAATLAAAAPVLTVQAAGNDGEQIDSPTDALDCAPGDLTNLLIGSYDPSQVRSVFSNFGACVDASGPGEDVLLPYAGGWLFPVSGTSFAAPLVARLLSLSAPTPFAPPAARAWLLARTLPDGSVPIGLFPRDLLYRPGGSASTAAGALRSSPSETATATPRLESSRPRASWYELERVLGPLAQVRGAAAGRRLPLTEASAPRPGQNM